MKRYLKNLMISADQFLNTLTGGDPDETLSSRAGKWHPTAARIIDWIFGPGHCQAARENDEGKNAVIK